MAREALAYFSVPYVLLTGDRKKLHNDIKGIVGKELASIEAHASFSPPEILAADNAAYKDPDKKTFGLITRNLFPAATIRDPTLLSLTLKHHCGTVFIRFI